MTCYEEIAFRTNQRSHWVDITEQVQKVIDNSKIEEGVVTVASLHTTGGITLNENADPDVGRDFFWKLDQLIPRESGYHHMEGNSDSHLKSSLVGFSVHVPVRNGKLVLGTWQSVYFCEFDGPRSRKAAVSVSGER